MVKLFENLREKMNMSKPPDIPDTTIETPTKDEKRFDGKIIKISGEGYGFISSKDIPFKRIFFHWTSLRPDTLGFEKLRSGMKVSFVAFEVEDRGWRAIKIKVEEE